MNSKQRVQVAFAHREPDRVPIFELTIDNPTAQFVLGRANCCGFSGPVRGLVQNRALREGWIDEFHRRRLADDIELWETLDLDVYPTAAPVPKNPPVPEQLDDHTWRFTDSATGLWTVYRYLPQSGMYDEVDSSLRQEGLPALTRLTAALEAAPSTLDDWDFSPVDTLVQTLGRIRFVMGCADVEIGSTFCWAHHFLTGLYDAPDLIHRYLDARLQQTLLLLEETLRRGVDGIHGGYDWASARGPMFSPAHFAEFVFPRLRQITALCRQYNVPYIKHTDGNVNALLPGMIEAGVDGFQAIEPGAGMDIAQLKRDYGHCLTLIGNVDCAGVLVHGPAEAVRAQTRQVIRQAASGGGFLLSSSNSIHPDVKPEYYLAMLDTARHAGAYPINIS